MVDGTGSMSTEIIKAKAAILNFTRTSGYKEVGVVIYRTHLENSSLLMVYPPNFRFTNDMNSIATFLNTVHATSGSGPENMLDGLA